METKYVAAVLIVLMLLVVLTACAGPKGDIGFTGPAGADGAVGAPGPIGNPGQNGQDASPVTVVQFCPGTTTYPSAFLEVGIVLNGKIYGVYSINNGFLTELPPGNYNSNAVGSSCNFIINNDLTISH